MCRMQHEATVHEMLETGSMYDRMQSLTFKPQQMHYIVTCKL